MQPICLNRPTARFIALAWLLLALLLSGISSAWAQDDDNILPVTEAYKLKADASTPGVVKLH